MENQNKWEIAGRTEQNEHAALNQQNGKNQNEHEHNDNDGRQGSSGCGDSGGGDGDDDKSVVAGDAGDQIVAAVLAFGPSSLKLTATVT